MAAELPPDLTALTAPRTRAVLPPARPRANTASRKAFASAVALASRGSSPQPSVTQPHALSTDLGRLTYDLCPCPLADRHGLRKRIRGGGDRKRLVDGPCNGDRLIFRHVHPRQRPASGGAKTPPADPWRFWLRAQRPLRTSCGGTTRPALTYQTISAVAGCGGRPRTSRSSTTATLGGLIPDAVSCSRQRLKAEAKPFCLRRPWYPRSDSNRQDVSIGGF